MKCVVFEYKLNDLSSFCLVEIEFSHILVIHAQKVGKSDRVLLVKVMVV